MGRVHHPLYGLCRQARQGMIDQIKSRRFGADETGSCRSWAMGYNASISPICYNLVLCRSSKGPSPIMQQKPLEVQPSRQVSKSPARIAVAHPSVSSRACSSRCGQLRLSAVVAEGCMPVLVPSQRLYCACHLRG